MPSLKNTGPEEHIWAAHRTELERLYLEEDKPLRQVMCYMKDEYGFIAKYAGSLFLAINRLTQT